MRIIIWVALLDLSAALLVAPYLLKPMGLLVIRRALSPFVSWMASPLRADLDADEPSYWLPIAIVTFAMAFLVLSIELKFRWFLLAPAIFAVAVPTLAVSLHGVVNIRPERRLPFFLAGGAMFLASKLLALTGALARL